MHVPDLLCLGGAAGIGRVISRSTLSPSVLLEMSSVCLNTKSHFIYLQLISSNGTLSYTLMQNDLQTLVTNHLLALPFSGRQNCTYWRDRPFHYYYIQCNNSRCFPLKCLSSTEPPPLIYGWKFKIREVIFILMSNLCRGLKPFVTQLILRNKQKRTNPPFHQNLYF